jgi:DNA polymerase III delta prime subunit
MLTHHAYYIEDTPALFEDYKQRLPHFVAQKYERFGVDEARSLARMAGLKNVSAEAVFLVAFGSITSEAEQALLKLFEEPQQGTVFVVLCPHGALGATLKSRMLEYPDDTKDGPLLNEGPSFVSQEANKFLKMSGKERSDFIAKLLKDEDTAKERVRDFVNALEVLLAKDIKKNAQALADIAMARDYLSDRAPSMKMLLEHLALSLPQI